MTRWFTDLALGVRLALGGGRTSWVRLALTGAGIGIGVAVLLTASSVPTVLSERVERQAGATPHNGEPGAGDVLHGVFWTTDYRGETIAGRFVQGSGPNAPVPPGMSRVPGDGEIFVSPALADLLASPDGELLRERFPQRVVGTIGQDGLNAPHDLTFYAGDATVEEGSGDTITRFGGERQERTLDPVLSLLILVGVVALLFPVLVFVGITTRLAGAERDRRLAALRLVGAGAQRVRRIAAGEALLGAGVGLVVGAALFFAARLFVENIRLLGVSVFVSDLTPSLPLAVLIAVLVPVLAVVTSVVAMRRTVVEPLGVVRRTKPVRRVLWWRLVPITVGAVALLTQAGAFGGTEVGGRSTEIVIGGIILLLLGIPVLLPWVVERAVGRLRGGAPSWQLAIRRLQLESGTAARVVGGVAVVLAGGIALQSVMASAQARIVDRPMPEADRGRIVVILQESEPELAEQTVALLQRAAGVERVHPMRTVPFKSGEDYYSATVGTCEVLKTVAALPNCRDGDSFLVDAAGSSPGYDRPVPEAGQPVRVFANPDDQEPTLPWTVPAFTDVKAAGDGPRDVSGLLVTPSLVRDLPATAGHTRVFVRVDQDRPDIAEHVRNAVAPMTWRTYAAYFGEIDLSDRVKQFQSVRQALLAGSLVTLLLAGASLLVLALEQVRERRRPLAVLAASGVPRGALGRSLLWQNAVPLLLALVVSVAVGGGLAVLLLRIISQPIVLDWPGIGVLSAAAALMVVVVTLLSLPSLRRATGALGLRSE